MLVGARHEDDGIMAADGMKVWSRLRRRLRRAAETPFEPLSRPLPQCRVALVVSSVCLAQPGQEDDPDVPMGRPRWRLVGSEDGGAAGAGAGHAAGAGRDAGAGHEAGAARDNEDRNLAMALETLNEAAARGRIGAVNGRHLVLGGPMIAGRGDLQAAAREAVEPLAADAVDAVVLVPT